MGKVIAIAMGGALGSVLRFWAAKGAQILLGQGFPYGTLLVNGLGSFLIGMFSVLLFDKLEYHNSILAGFIMVGVLGGFTTFSSFSLETMRMLYTTQYTGAMINIFANVSLSLVAVFVGLKTAQHLFI